MGGLCFAIALARSIPDYASRIDVDIYESTSSLEGQVGAGIVLYAYTWGILEYLGVDKELAKYTKSIISDEPRKYL
jgi:salicylate hydroxylase